MSIEDKIELSIEWIETLARNDFNKEIGQMQWSSSFCCLGVARHIHRLGEDDEYVLTPKERASLGLTHRGIDRLVQLNDGYGDVKPTPHTEIAKEMIKNPNKFFIDGVAQGIKEHFWKSA